MNRTDLHHLAELRLKEAKVLLDAGCFEGLILFGWLRHRVWDEGLLREEDRVIRSSE